MNRQALYFRPVVQAVRPAHLAPKPRLAAINDAFHEAGGVLFGYALAAVGPAHEVEQAAGSAARVAGLPSISQEGKTAGILDIDGELIPLVSKRSHSAGEGYSP